VSDERTMRLRYAGTCEVCGVAIPARSTAIYSPARRAVRCVACGPRVAPPAEAETEREPAIKAGVAGASARRIYEQRKNKRENAVRATHPKLGGLFLTLSGDPQTTRAWDRGAVGRPRASTR
jgi:hypothetical protein